MKHFRSLSATLFLSFLFLISHSQPGAEIELQKPKKYENRKLGAEKTGEKRFTVPRKIYQNTVTHYNYYFNANNRLNDIVDRAKLSFKDDYSQLLSFYNYSLDATSQDKGELDSVIYKCTAGILLHDLRNSWIDNMYLLLAKAYYFRKDQDSANLTLQYINFSFAPKEDGGYDKPIGSNASNDNGEFSISTKEKNSIWNKLTSRPPSRNESFIWQVRNHIEMNELPEASGVIEILRNDPNFPARLHTDLEEVLAYWFYKQQVYDSSAYHLSKALNEASTGQERARWEYLIAQMYQLSNKNDDAIEYYNRSIKHTSDPVMDVYARLNSIRINKGDNKDFVQNNIDALHQMARRDKYANYRDIIYYAAATIELERNNFDNAQSDLLKSVKYTTNNPPQRSQSFLLLGDMNFNRKAYPPVYSFYDSVEVNSLAKAEDRERLESRKPALKTIAENTLALNNQDSLQSLAKLPAEQRDAIIKKIARQLRKAQGLKDEDLAAGSSNPAVQQQASNLFAANDNSNDFYFYNASNKARGFSEFKGKWGQRANVDNWRRQSAINRQNPVIANLDNPATSTPANTVDKTSGISFEALLGNVPLTETQLAESNKTVLESLYNLAQTFTNKLEDYPSAIQAYEEILRRFPNTTYKEEILFNLANAYQKTGDKEKADFYKKELIASSPNGKLTQLIQNPLLAKDQPNPATRKYEEIYNLFIEGKFDEAKTEKKTADSLYGNSYWTPQLLFIESIYYVKQKDDSTAIKVLTDLTKLYASNPMAERAKTMIDVLRRRTQIEDYLTKLDVNRAEGTRTTMPVDNTIAASTKEVKPVTTTPKVEDKPITNVIKPETPPVKKDTSITPPPTVAVKSFTFVPADPQYVVVVMDKVDEVYANEARNAFNRYNREKFYNQQIAMSGLKLDDRYSLVLQGPFTDAKAAIDYVNVVKPIAGSRILPWLSIDKFSFIIISNANLNLLKNNKDMTAYRQLLLQAFPGKF